MNRRARRTANTPTDFVSHPSEEGNDEANTPTDFVSHPSEEGNEDNKQEKFPSHRGVPRSGGVFRRGFKGTFYVTK